MSYPPVYAANRINCGTTGKMPGKESEMTQQEKEIKSLLNELEFIYGVDQDVNLFSVKDRERVCDQLIELGVSYSEIDRIIREARHGVPCF